MKKDTEGRNFGRLLVFLLAYLFLTPFIPETSTTTIIVQALLTVTLFFAANAVQKKQSQRKVALSVVGIAIVLHWLGVYDVVPFSSEGALFLFTIFYGFLIYAFIKQLLQAKQVTSTVLTATLSLYLIIGLFWGAGYNLIHILYDGTAFSGALLEDIQTSQLHLFNYFSMVTLTTLGYGDITPQIPEAASLCQMEAIVGQFFTAVLVAWLVGMYGKPVGKNQDSPE